MDFVTGFIAGFMDFVTGFMTKISKKKEKD